jgi:hypothetical protein
MKRFLAILSIVGVVAGVARAQQPGLHKTCKRRHSTVRGIRSSLNRAGFVGGRST